MLKSLLSRPTFRYSPLESETRPRASLVPKVSLRLLLTYIFAFSCVASVGFWAGRSTAKDHSRYNIQLDTVSQIFRYNRTFGEAPSNITNRVWATLFPKQGGFFKHPTLAPRRSAFSVFHQLHCLDGIREGYWTAFQAAVDGRTLVEDDLPMMSSPRHIRHCIDLLRHALMCQPDTTVEIKDDGIGGVKGFGTRHQCRDWDQLMRWTSRWETFQQETRNRTGKMVQYSHPRP